MTYKVFIEKNKVLFLQFDEWINGIVRNGIVRNGLVKNEIFRSDQYIYFKPEVQVTYSMSII